MSTVIVAVQCKHCSKFKPPLEIWEMPGGATICPDCRDAHQIRIEELVELLSGGLPNCPVCHKTGAELKILAGGGDYPMHIHQIDGVYLPMCDGCHRQYVPQRKDLYGGTQFGEEMNLR